MKTSDAVKIAKIEAASAREKDLLKLVTNPLVTALAIFVLVEFLQKKGYMGTIAGSALETAAIATPVLQSAFESGAAEKYLETIGNLAKSSVEVTGNLVRGAGTMLLTKGA